MPLSWSQMLQMWLRGLPVQQMRAAVNLSETAGLNLSLQDLESQALAGGNPVQVVEALIFAKKFDIATSFMEVPAVDLAGFNPPEAIKQCPQERQVQFLTLNPDSREHIRGRCADGTLVDAVITVRMKLPAGHVLGFRMDQLHTRLAGQAAALLADNPELSRLKQSKDFFESRLTEIAREFAPTVRVVEIQFHRVGDPSPEEAK